jgi:hypothetical protein
MGHRVSVKHDNHYVDRAGGYNQAIVFDYVEYTLHCDSSESFRFWSIARLDFFYTDNTPSLMSQPAPYL